MTVPADHPFRLRSAFAPSGDQPRAIDELVAGLAAGRRHQVLLGVTGSGKTFTMAQVVERVQRPALVLAPNKTLADTYIEKDSSVNDAIDKMRHSATRALLTRRDVLIVASVSCIYGLGSPEEYLAMNLLLAVGQDFPPEEARRRLVFMLYERNDLSLERGAFRARGDVLEIFPAHEEDRALRVEFFGDTVESLSLIDPLRGVVLERLRDYTVFPRSHYVTSTERLAVAMESIRVELRERLTEFQGSGRLLEAQRLEQRTLFDLEMIEELGYCNGIENYSRHLTGKQPGEPPPTLLDYLPDDFLLFIDESHIAVPQIGGMFNGDRSRKQTLVDFGFRLPSALDNRPLRFDEFETRVHQIIYVSATPGPYELGKAKGVLVEQLIRPTGLLDPRVEVRPAVNQVDDLLEEIRQREERGEAVLVTTLTKRMAEELTEYYGGLGVRVRYLHSDIDTIERMELLRGLRRGEFQVLVGINLLREGLDLPEVSLVAILDADKEGFLRSERSLVQTCGRAARNADGLVLLYADSVTDSMARTISETNRRRAAQQAHNQAHGITPRTVRSEIKDSLRQHLGGMPGDGAASDAAMAVAEPEAVFDSLDAVRQRIVQLERQMRRAAAELAFEEAAGYRDRIRELRQLEIELG